jgi:hypothetical protein
VALRLGKITVRTPAALAAAALAAIWLLSDPRTPDLAAQVYRVNLFREQGFALWDLRWYAGHPLPGYSLLFPPLAAWLGIRVLAAVAVVVSTLLGERLLPAIFGESARWGVVWLAVALVADLWIGRLTYALGVTFALAAMLALLRGRLVWAGAAAALCSAASPVAGVLLAFAVVTLVAVTGAAPRHALRGAASRHALRGAASRHALRGAASGHALRTVLAVASPALVVVVALGVLFPEGGWEPYPATSFLATTAIVLGFIWALPTGWGRLRAAAALYLVACVACVALHTPMGANVERYGLLLAGPLLVCALGSAAAKRAVPGDAAPGSDRVRGQLAQSAGRRVLAGAVLAAIALWTLWGPVRETAAVAGDASTGAAYYLPLERFLAAHGGALVRVEVPFTRSHWEATWLAPAVSLARGWEKQLDTRYDDVLLRPGLTATEYRRWLLQQAVTYVALPDVPLDPSSSQEGRLIVAGQPYLQEVFRSTHWRVYRVLGATPLLAGPGRLTALGHDSFALDARAPATFLVRVHYTRYWTAGAGTACIAPAPGGWTYVSVPRAGAVVVSARFSLARALGLTTQVCHGVGNQPPVGPHA